MEPTSLIFKALPGQIKLGDLYNSEPTELVLEGYAIPPCTNDAGFLERPGFDIVNMHLRRETEFSSAQAVVYAPAGKWIHWKSCEQAVQWADEQVIK